MRSMETLSLRMQRVGRRMRRWWRSFLRKHPKIAAVNYLGFLAAMIRAMRYSSGNAIARARPSASAVKGGEAEAFRLLDGLQVIKLAVSLGGTETLDLASGEHHAFGRVEGDARSNRRSPMR